MVDGGDQHEGGRPLLGYAVSFGIVLVAIVALAALLISADYGGDEPIAGDVPGEQSAQREEPDLLPEGGGFPTPDEDVGVREAAKAAGCELEEHPVRSREHIKSLEEDVRYSSRPPTSGRHYVTPAEDAAYVDSPDPRLLVHTMEHSRVIVWFERDLPRPARAALKAFYDSDDFLMVLVPDTTNMPYEVAATAWNRNPLPNGTGRLLGCPEYGASVFTALEAFKEANRGRGLERPR